MMLDGSSRPHLYLNGQELRLDGGMSVEVDGSGGRAKIDMPIDYLELGLAIVKTLGECGERDSLDFRTLPFVFPPIDGRLYP